MVILSFESYKSMSIYMYDSWGAPSKEIGRIKMDEIGFGSKNPPIKIKFLPNDAMDIVNIDGKFISDIKLTSQQKSYIENIDVNTVPLERSQDNTIEAKKLDYELDIYWALTSKMRNYDVGFKYSTDTNKIKNTWGKILYDYNNIAEDEMEEESDCSFESAEDDKDSDDDSEDEYEYFTPNTTIDDQSMLNIEDIYSDSENTLNNTYDGFLEQLNKTDADANDIITDCVEEKVIARSKEPVLPTEMFKALLMCRKDRDCNKSNPMQKTQLMNLIILKYTSEKCNYCVKIEIGRIVMLEMFITDHKWVEGRFTEPESREPVLSAILFTTLHCNGVDLCLQLHSVEGTFNTGFNFYKRDDNTVGIIFCGEQNVAEPINYARCLNDGIIVPDLLLTNEAVADMSNYSVPKTKIDYKYWYNYEDLSSDEEEKEQKNTRELLKLVSDAEDLRSRYLIE